MVNRRADRVNFFSVGQLSCAGQLLDVSVVDISLNGVLLAATERHEEFHLGAPADVSVRLSGGDLEMVFAGRIARTDGAFIGIEFAGMDLDTATHLRRLIELNTGKPALVERAFDELGA